MSAAAVMQIVCHREQNDCAVVAMAMYLGESYEDVLRHVSLTDRRQGRDGLWSRTMIRIAKRLGHTLKQRATFDIESDYGILRTIDHAAVLRNGLVFEGNATVWDADAFLLHRKTKLHECTLFVCEE
jgi:hypothetical protein